MNYDLILLLVVLAIMSLAQRVLPWIFYSKIKSGSSSLEKTFDLFAISAFSALLVYNVTSFSPFTLVALAIALLVTIKFHNTGLTVLVALAVISLSLVL